MFFFQKHFFFLHRLPRVGARWAQQPSATALGPPPPSIAALYGPATHLELGAGNNGAPAVAARRRRRRTASRRPELAGGGRSSPASAGRRR